MVLGIEDVKVYCYFIGGYKKKLVVVRWCVNCLFVSCIICFIDLCVECNIEMRDCCELWSVDGFYNLVFVVEVVFVELLKSI